MSGAMMSFLATSVSSFSVTPLAGSLQFTGGAASHSSSYLSLSPGISFGSGAFCFEGWFQLPNFTSAYGMLGATANYALSFFVASNTSFSTDSYGGHGASSLTVPTMSANKWYYFALVRNGSNQMTLFLGNTPGGSAARSSSGIVTNSINYFTSSNPSPDIGTYYGQGWPGYLTNIRAVIGSTPYSPTSTSITVPYAPLTNITNTQYLMLGDSITSDASGVQTVTSHGTVTQSSVVKPF
jgi:Concanavalin A-like lectin/glucanases superfamily